MKPTLFWLALLLGAQPLEAATVKLASPDIVHVHADGDVIEHTLFWNRKEQTLYAYLELSNHFYATKDEPLFTESYVLRIPGVTFDPRTKDFSAESKPGQRLVVATLRSGFLSRYIEPATGTTLIVYKHSDEVTVVLTSDSDAEPCGICGHWDVQESNASLQKLIRSITGQPPVTP